MNESKAMFKLMIPLFFNTLIQHNWQRWVLLFTVLCIVVTVSSSADDTSTEEDKHRTDPTIRVQEPQQADTDFSCLQ